MIGSVIGGHIRITGALGQGGMGDVYAGVDERLSRQVAVKTVRAGLGAVPRERFLREARTLSALDHPNICRIYEYIESPDGDFLVLELIDGVTLRRAIERGMSRARKLRVAAEILSALVAAHRKGIVHRDIKPDNIMIAAGGAVKVLDFGIARLEAPEPLDADADAGVAVPIEDAATLIYPIAGAPSPSPISRSIAGTPVYMSPEQAVGGEITPASDLYSFGLLLQALLTELPPQDATGGSTEVLRRAARGESVAMTGQPRDVTRLVASLKDLEAANRPTAAEALAAVQRIIDKPKRRIRLAAALVLLAVLLGGAAKYAVDITRARREAERRRDQAEELVRFMVGDLRRKLEPVGRLDALDGAASHALAYYASLPPEEMTGEDLNQNSLALAQLGEARLKQAKLVPAIALFRQSVRFADAAAARPDASEEWQLTLSNAHFWLGDALRRSGDARGTLVHFNEYARISQVLARRHPGDPKYEAEVSYAHGNIGAAHELAGDLPRAIDQYRIAYDLDRARMTRFPADEQWQSDTANSANRLGVVLQRTGDLPGARAAFDQDLRLRRKLAQAVPNDARRQQRLAVSLAFAGKLHDQMGDVDQALACYREEADISTLLAARDPSNVDSRRNRDVANIRLASLLDAPRGLPLAQSATADLREIVRADTRREWALDLVFSQTRIASLALQNHRLADARGAASEALASMERLASQRPGNAQSIRLLCDALLTAAAIDEREGRRELAAQRRQRAADSAKPVISEPAVLALRARALLALGRDGEAAPVASKLIAGGYREREFMKAAARLQSTHSPPIPPGS